MTQGFDLDLEHGIDPHYATSKMINPAMGAAEAGVSPRRVGDIYGVMRPYPIRVNNREGSSGPYSGAKEITWEEVSLRSGFPGVLAEITTTTKLPRRVFEFSARRMRKFIQVCGPTHMCLQFANYIDHAAKGVRTWEGLPAGVQNWVTDYEANYGIPVTYIGTGPDHDDMIDVSHAFDDGE
jgi:adenylosuccinate synthase